MPEFRGLLKLHTASAHKTLDSLPDVAAHLSKQLPIVVYCRALRVQGGFFQKVETAVSHVASTEHGTDVPTDWNERVGRAAAAEVDLAFFAGQPKICADGTSNSLAESSLPPSLAQEFENRISGFAQTPGGVLGLLYVTEGASLGSMVIARALEQHHGFTPTHGAAFFGARGSRTPALWAAFLEHLAARDAFYATKGEQAHAAMRDTALAAALFLFETLTRAFQDANPSDTSGSSD